MLDHLCTYLVWKILSNYSLNLCLLTLPVREIQQMVFICEIIVALLVDENDCHYNLLNLDLVLDFYDHQQRCRYFDGSFIVSLTS
jgi:hypothetical protein